MIGQLDGAGSYLSGSSIRSWVSRLSADSIVALTHKMGAATTESNAQTGRVTGRYI